VILLALPFILFYCFVITFILALISFLLTLPIQAVAKAANCEWKCEDSFSAQFGFALLFIIFSVQGIYEFFHLKTTHTPFFQGDETDHLMRLGLLLIISAVITWVSFFISMNNRSQLTRQVISFSVKAVSIVSALAFFVPIFSWEILKTILN